jgi:rod shape determining protein RodA
MKLRLAPPDLGLGLPLYRLPWLLLLATGGAVAYGAIYVTSAAGMSAPETASKHLLWIGIGLAGFLLAYSMDFRFYLRLAPLLYAAGMLALVAVLFTSPVKGARSWFRMGGIMIQPAEFVKLIVILMLVRVLAAAPEPLRFRDLAAAGLVICLPVGLILMQTDLGTALTFVPMMLAATFAAGARLWHMGLGAAGAAAAAVGMWQVVDGARRTRIYAWLNPEQYKLEQAYQLIQSQIAAGSGGLWGKGLGLGTQNQFDLLPIKESDFIFAVIAEEGGFLRASALLFCMVLIVLSGASIAMRSDDRRGQLLAAAVTALLGGQVIVNISVAMGLLPTTGLTLPFVSYGGSSMLTSFIALGLLANVNARPSPRGLFGRG